MRITSVRFERPVMTDDSRTLYTCTVGALNDQGDYFEASGIEHMMPSAKISAVAEVSKLIADYAAATPATPAPSSESVDNLVRGLINKKYATMEADYKDNPSKKELFDAAKSHHQDEVNQLCQTLGITPVKLLPEGGVHYTVLESVVLINELKRVVELQTKISAE